MIKTSIIIPNLHSPIVDKTIDSIKMQISKYVEVIVVGKDKYNLIKEDKQIKFIKTKEIKNPSEARNIGIDNAKGEILVFIDADCIADKNWLDNLLKHQRNGIEVVGGSVDFDDKNFWTLCDNISHFYALSPKRKQDNNKMNIATINLCITKDLALMIGKFNEKLVTGEDLDFVMKIKKLNHNLFFEPSAKVYHHPNRESFRSLIKHDLEWAKNSINVRLQYSNLLKTPSKIFINRSSLILFSPFVALIKTFRIFFIENKEYLKYWHTIPIIFISKMAWCFGAAKGLKK